MTTDFSTKEESKQQRNPLQLIGIALIVETVGKGAKLVLRYPAAPLSSPYAHDNKNNGDDHLFFSLQSRVMEKLFRPKSPHCGRPMTLSVGGSVFCCRALLMPQQDLDTSNNSAGSKLVLFSVVVALSHRRNESGENLRMESAERPFVSDVERVHMSLSRLCRVLKREEERCEYVSHQSQTLMKIREDERKKITPKQVESPQKHRRGKSSSFASGEFVNPEGMDKAPADESETLRKMEENEHALLEIMMAARLSSHTGVHRFHRGNLARELAQVYHALSRNYSSYLHSVPSSLLTSNNGIVHINAHISVPIEPLSAYSTPSPTQYPLHHHLRPYQTLLFPHSSSPKQLLPFLTSSSSSIAINQHLPKLLLMANPHKPLSDIALDAKIPLPQALDLASQLVHSDLATVSSVITRSTRFAANDRALGSISQLSLPFAQHFSPHVPLFMVASILTSSGKSLGTILSELHTTYRSLASRIASSLSTTTTPFSTGNASSPLVDMDKLSHSLPKSTTSKPLPPSDAPPAATQPTAFLRGNDDAEDPLEKILCSMAVWLRAHNIITEYKEYFVHIAKKPVNASLEAEEWNVEAPSRDSSKQLSLAECITKQREQYAHREEEMLYQELLNHRCFDGTVSTEALCWRMGLDSRQLRRFRDWAMREKKILTIMRVPVVGDDWGVAL